MTLDKLKTLCAIHRIPSSVKLLSDSGWECDETEMDGVYYNRDKNVIIFTQGGSYEDVRPYRNDAYGELEKLA